MLVDRELLRTQSGELAQTHGRARAEAHAVRRRSRSTSTRRSSCRTSCSTKLELPVHAQDADRPALDGGGRARGTRRELPAAAHHPRVPRPRQAQVHLHRQAAGADRPEDRPRAHLVSPGGRGHRTAVVAAIRTCRTSRSARAEGRRIRQAFIAPHGPRAACGRLFADRAAHHGAPVGRRRPARALRRGRRHPPATAAEVFGVAAGRGHADQRRAAKAINFGLIYGMSAFGLARQLGIERGAAQDYIDRYFARYPGVRVTWTHARAGARARLRRDRVRPAALSAGHQLAQPAACSRRRARARSTRRCRARRPTSSSGR